MRWTSYLPWSVAPLFLGTLCFGFLSIINWPYENKLVLARTGSSLNSTETYLGPIMLACAAGNLLLAGGLLFLLRHFWAMTKNRALVWFAVLPLAIGTFLLTTAGLNIVLLGPAAITLIEQTRNMPH